MPLSHFLVNLLVVGLLLLHSDELFDPIVHLLDGLVLGDAHALAVGYIIEAVLGLGVLAGGAADLRRIIGQEENCICCQKFGLFCTCNE